MRGAAGLGLAVLAARLTGVQHSFWVVLGALSVLRSNALNTGQDAVRAILGTVAGFIACAALLAGIGTNTTLLWVLLPLAVFFAGVAPACMSFAGGQAAFTLTVVILFNIDRAGRMARRPGADRRRGPRGGREPGRGCPVLAAGRGGRAPPGAGRRVRRRRGLPRRHGAIWHVTRRPRHARSGRRRGAGRRGIAPAFDDAFRTFLAERGAKRFPLADVAGLVTGVAGLRLEADAVLDLWRGDDGQAGGDMAAARREILGTAARVTGWYDRLATTLITGGEVPQPLAHDTAADGRLIRAVRRDLLGDDGRASATAVRMIWTSDHLDVICRQQAGIISTSARHRRAARGRPHLSAASQAIPGAAVIRLAEAVSA